ncbi:hypothetical protein BpHYR1_038921 [Brachionus plicatilis]|uniref:Transmembrane protein n=1 Tax=Brachionus plicatilis TaxID=10195 RepID=A0A3M7S0I1_BRAPC|nr:hypothetical protein BpHYR1_038921 [Brachionus plicatilis]
MIFLNSNGHNNREGQNQQDENGKKSSSSRNSQPQLANGNVIHRKQKIIKKRNSCKETTAKVLAFIGVFGLLAGIGLLVFGIIEYVNTNNSSKSVAIASIASASALIVVSISNKILMMIKFYKNDDAYFFQLNALKTKKNLNKKFYYFYNFKLFVNSSRLLHYYNENFKN